MIPYGKWAIRRAKWGWEQSRIDKLNLQSYGILRVS